MLLEYSVNGKKAADTYQRQDLEITETPVGDTLNGDWFGAL